MLSTRILCSNESWRGKSIISLLCLNKLYLVAFSKLIIFAKRADFNYSTSWSSTLRFPLLSSITNSRPAPTIHVSKTTLDISHYSQALVLASIHILNVLQILQFIYAEIETKEATSLNRQSISSAIYSVEYRLFMMQQNGPTYPTMMVNDIDLAEPLRLAAHLFLHLAIRELPAHSKTYQKMSEQLQSILPDYIDLEVHGALHSSLSLLLWILFIGGVASLDPTTKWYFVKCLARVSRTLRLRHQDDFIHSLRKTLWAENYYYPSGRKLWEEMRRA